MGGVLRRLERALILEHGDDHEPERESKESIDAELAHSARAPATRRVLKGAPLGEFTLGVHSYLLLLDFNSPAYTSAATDEMHRKLQVT